MSQGSLEIKIDSMQDEGMFLGIHGNVWTSDVQLEVKMECRHKTGKFYYLLGDDQLYPRISAIFVTET